MVVKQNTTNWKSTGTQNLIRYKPSGTYFARFKIRRKPYRISLKTNVLTTARLRLPDVMRHYRARFQAERALQGGKIIFLQALKAYLEGIDGNVRLKPRSKAYRHLLSKFIIKTWPGVLLEADIRKINERDCERWLFQFQKLYAPSVINNAIGTLRAVFEIAVKAGARFDNPASNLKRVKIRPKRLNLPSRDQFDQFVQAIATAGAPQSHDCAALTKFLAYSGARISEAGFVTWQDVDFARRQLLVRGDPKTGTKNNEFRLVPLIPQLETMLVEMRANRADEAASTAIMRVKECQRSMDRAAKVVGMARITHHDLRHLFATVCIESGVDIPTVSRWCGHKDGGALCMKTYGHLREAHSLIQAQRVQF
jgi:integrase